MGYTGHAKPGSKGMLGRNVNSLKPFRARKGLDQWWITSPATIAFELDKKKALQVMRALNAVIKEAFGPKRRKGARYARRKGLSFERDVAIWLRPWFPHARRQLEFQAACAEGVDLAETAHFRFQCKKLKEYVSVNTIREIQCVREFGEIPVLVTAGDNQEPMVVLPFKDFLTLLPKCPETPKKNK